MFVRLSVCLFARLLLWSVSHAEPIHEPFVVVVFVIVVVVAVLYLIVRVNLLLLGRPSVRLSVSQCVSHVVCSLVS